MQRLKGRENVRLGINCDEKWHRKSNTHPCGDDRFHSSLNVCFTLENGNWAARISNGGSIMDLLLG